MTRKAQGGLRVEGSTSSRRWRAGAWLEPMFDDSSNTWSAAFRQFCLSRTERGSNWAEPNDHTSNRDTSKQSSQTCECSATKKIRAKSIRGGSRTGRGVGRESRVTRGVAWLHTNPGHPCPFLWKLAPCVKGTSAPKKRAGFKGYISVHFGVIFSLISANLLLFDWFFASFAYFFLSFCISLQIFQTFESFCKFLYKILIWR